MNNYLNLIKNKKNISSFVIFISLLINIIGCTSPLIENNNISKNTSEKENNSIQNNNPIIRKSRYIGDKTSLSAIEKDYFSPYDRQYSKINSSLIYNHTKNLLENDGFNIVRLDSSRGLILAEKEISTSKNFMLWTWERKSIVFISLNATHKTNPDILIDVVVFFMEKSPLSKDYKEIDDDKETIALKESIIKSIDETVVKAGGSF